MWESRDLDDPALSGSAVMQHKEDEASYTVRLERAYIAGLIVWRRVLCGESDEGIPGKASVQSCCPKGCSSPGIAKTWIE